ncbi:MAG: hypothetical protein GX638_12390 [Crenarchaeota archaeon]|nr:hypothetical protein [Thermoproteota archaeon]
MIYPWGLEFIISQITKFPSAAMALAMQWRDYIFYPYLLSPRENFLFTYFGESFLNNSFAQTLFRTKLLKEALPFPKGILSGDTFIKKKISLKNQVLMVSGPISWWRKTPGQASSKLKANYAGFFDSWVIDNLIINEPDCPLTEKERLAIKTDRLFTLKKIILKELFRFNLPIVIKSLELAPLKNIVFATRRIKPIYKAFSSPEKPLMISHNECDYSNT